MNGEAIPVELRDRKQWLVWRTETRGGKPTKVPLVARLPKDRGAASGTQRRFPASTTDPSTWRCFEEALAVWRSSEGFFDGIGYVFAADDPFAGIDLDDCVDDGGELHSEAAAVALHLDSYTERSPSGRGVHVITRGVVNGRRNRTGKTAWGGMFEIYDRARFFCFTGDRLPDTAASIELRQAQLDELLEHMFPAPATNGTAAAARPLELDDRELLERAFAAKNGADLDRLYRGDLGSYPSQSEADLALCGLLAFWTGPDPARIDHLFRGSALMRDKWDMARGDSTYGAQTIATALAGRREFFYEPRAQRGFTATAHPESPKAEGPGESPESEQPRATDVGNAARFAAQHGDKARFVTGLHWYLWDSKRWKPDRAGGVERLARQTARAILAEAARADSDEERKTLAAWALKSESEPRLRACLSLAESERALVALPERLDSDPWLLNTSSGTVDLRTGELRAHDRADLITKLAPVEYDLGARSEEWDQFLATVTGGDSELTAFLARAVGYTLTGNTREEVLFFVHGPGQTGKSTFSEAIKAVLGPYAHVADFESFLRKRGDGGIRNDIARLAGARLVLSLEVDEGKRLAEGLVKSLTGGDTVAARFLHREFFEFTPAFKLWLIANHRPRVSADDDGIWRRIVQVPFSRVIPEAKRDDTLKERFRTDPQIKTAVLAWAVAGCLDWQRRGLGVPDVVRTYTDEYRAENDPIAEWLADECELAAEHWTATRELRDTYERWCEAAGASPIDLNGAWGTALKRHGCASGKRGGKRGWNGIRAAAGRLDGC